jgi:hypothetical protein
MQLLGGPSAIYEMDFISSGSIGAPLDVNAEPLFLQTAFATAPRIVATGGIQDALDAHFTDGSVDSFEFILSTPEPSSLLVLGTIVFGLALSILARKRYRRRA